MQTKNQDRIATPANFPAGRLSATVYNVTHKIDDPFDTLWINMRVDSSSPTVGFSRLKCESNLRFEMGSSGATDRATILRVASLIALYDSTASNRFKNAAFDLISLANVKGDPLTDTDCTHALELGRELFSIANTTLNGVRFTAPFKWNQEKTDAKRWFLNYSTDKDNHPMRDFSRELPSATDRGSDAAANTTETGSGAPTSNSAKGAKGRNLTTKR